MQAGIVQRIFNDHFDDYRRNAVLQSRESYAAWCIMTCRSEEQGYHIDACPNGDYQVAIYNSCKHRACPQCGATDTEMWLERRKAQALACSYFHIVFTISHDLHIIWRFNRKTFTSMILRAAWHCLRELLSDPNYLGATPGAVASFQSWDDQMREHCHAHFIVSAGGLATEGRWIDAKPAFLLPTPVLAAKFRGKLLAYLRKGFSKQTRTGRKKPEEQVLRAPTGMSVQQVINLLNKLGRMRWHVDIEPAYEHANGVFKYVGRYICRGPISERRIIGYDGQNVTIAYAHADKHDQPTFTLGAHEFIRRLLSHVPEKGTHVVRSYGLFHPNSIEKLNMARQLLGQPPQVAAVKPATVFELLHRMFPDQKIGRCPKCARQLRTVLIYRGGQAPRWKLAA